MPVFFLAGGLRVEWDRERIAEVVFDAGYEQASGRDDTGTFGFVTPCNENPLAHASGSPIMQCALANASGSPMHNACARQCVRFVNARRSCCHRFQ